MESNLNREERQALLGLANAVRALGIARETEMGKGDDIAETVIYAADEALAVFGAPRTPAAAPPPTRRKGLGIQMGRITPPGAT